MVTEKVLKRLEKESERQKLNVRINELGGNVEMLSNCFVLAELYSVVFVLTFFVYA